MIYRDRPLIPNVYPDAERPTVSMLYPGHEGYSRLICYDPITLIVLGALVGGIKGVIDYKADQETIQQAIDTAKVRQDVELGNAETTRDDLEAAALLAGTQAGETHGTAVGTADSSFETTMDLAEERRTFLLDAAEETRQFLIEQAVSDHDFTLAQALSNRDFTIDQALERYTFVVGEAAANQSLAYQHAQTSYEELRDINFSQRGQARAEAAQGVLAATEVGAREAGANRASAAASGVRGTGSASSLQAEAQRYYDINADELDRDLTRRLDMYELERARYAGQRTRAEEAAERAHESTTGGAQLALGQATAAAGQTYQGAIDTAGQVYAGDIAGAEFGYEGEVGAAEFGFSQTATAAAVTYEQATSAADLAYEHSVEQILGTDIDFEDLIAGNVSFTEDTQFDVAYENTISDINLIYDTEIDWLEGQIGEGLGLSVLEGAITGGATLGLALL